ncbi:MAG: YqgE/AlgH family protein [Myxococcaceae bacterium]|nr:YqgE/AlgH family protein [Myxococcaceae bacterium]MCA3013103.1 YqgE/AlgH family protein [Myxococcaceae bacterium]
MSALAPGFLIAMPQMLDPNFARTVVLVLEHDDEGAMGLVINRAADLTFADLKQSQRLEIAPGRELDPIFVGGPVEPHRGFVLHDDGSVAERAALLPGLFLSVTTDALEPLVKDPSTRLRFCLGYAGWGPGQIEREIQQGSWLFTEARPDVVLTGEPERVWSDVITSMGVDPAMLVTTGGIRN